MVLPNVSKYHGGSKLAQYVGGGGGGGGLAVIIVNSHVHPLHLTRP